MINKYDVIEYIINEKIKNKGLTPEKSKMYRGNMRKFLFLLLFFYTQFAFSKDAIEETIDSISEDIFIQLSENSKVLILDFLDSNNNVSYLGKYFADKLQINLSLKKEKDIKIIERSKLEVILEEIKIQKSGLFVDSETVKIGNMLGANKLILGEIVDLDDTVQITLKIKDIERGIVTGGLSKSIKKDRKVNKLFEQIIKKSKNDEEEIENIKKKAIEEMEIYKKNRIAAIETEINNKKNEVKRLEDEIKSKSIILNNYEKKRQELYEISNKINEIHREIDYFNSNILKILKIGMTKQEIINILGTKRVSSDFFGNCFIVGKYFLIFEGDVLAKVVENGSRTRAGNIVDSCSFAKSSGVNIADY